MSQYERETRPMNRDDYEGQAEESYGRQGYYGPGYGYGAGWGRRGGMRGATMPVETKPFFLTSEFWAALALIVALAVATGASDELDDRLFWTLATIITSVYVLSRGIAKSGTKSGSWDPREEGMQRLRERVGRD